MKKISKAIRISGIFLKFFIISALSTLIILKYGIKIDGFAFANINLEQLYIKLDKKIILRANNITIPNFKPSKDNINSSNYLLNLSQNAIWLDMFFEEISLKNIKIADKSSKILYKDDIFFIDNDYFLADLKIKEQIDKKTELIIINNMQFKDFNISLKGDVRANLKDKNYSFYGVIKSYEIEAQANISLIEDELIYQIYNAKADSIKDFMGAIGDKFHLNKHIKEWIYGNVIAKEYLIKQLNGKLNLKNNNFFLNDMNATAKMRDIDVKLSKESKAISIKEAYITLKNSNLEFEFLSPTYQGYKLDGSKLKIHDIFSPKNSGLVLNLKTKAIYDNSVNEILKNYGINIPIEQKSGSNDANVNISVDFSTLNVIANANITLKNAKFNIANVPFKANEAVVRLKDNFIIDIDAKGFGMNFFNSDAVAQFDLKSKTAKIDGVIKSLEINSKDNAILNLKNEPFNAVLDFSKKPVKIDFLDMGVYINIADKSSLEITKPLKFIQNSKILTDIGVLNASDISIKTDNFKDFDILANGSEFDISLMDKNANKYNKQDFKIELKNNTLSGFSKDNKIKFKSDANLTSIAIKDIDIILKDNNKSLNTKNKIEIKVINSNLILLEQNKTLRLPNYEVMLDQNGLSFISKVDGGYIKFIKKDSDFMLEAKDISGEYINQFINKDSFFGGRFKLKLIGNKIRKKGEVRFYDTYLKDYIFYQRLLSFINSIPSLINLKIPDFNGNGFAVKNGKIMFEINDDILNFIAIEINGSSADILGTGKINLKDKTINIDLKLEILKDAIRLIDKIPIANQIILGRDRSFSTIIKIRGTTDEPVYSTEILKDTILLPFKLIRNILQMPFLIFE